MNKKMFAAMLLIVFCVFVGSGCGGGSGSSSKESSPLVTPVPNVPTPLEPEKPEPSEPQPDEPEILEPEVPELNDPISEDMLEANFWIQRMSDSNVVLLSADEIVAHNLDTISADSYMVDLVTIESIPEAIFSDYGYIAVTVDGQQISIEELFEEFEAQRSKLSELKYAIVVKRSAMSEWPLLAEIAEYPCNVWITAAEWLEVNTPLIVSEVCYAYGKTFYYAQGENKSGWIPEDNIAFCNSKEEWNAAWNVESDSADFVVVKQNCIVSVDCDNIELVIGTVLKIAQDENNGYIAVYIPTRDEYGVYKTDIAFLKTEKVHLGFMPLTQANLLEMIFNQAPNAVDYDYLAQREVWHAIRQIFGCFGMKISSEYCYEALEELESKKNVLEFPAGTILFTTRGIVQYIGSIDNMPYGMLNINYLVTLDQELYGFLGDEVYGYLNLF